MASCQLSPLPVVLALLLAGCSSPGPAPPAAADLAAAADLVLVAPPPDLAECSDFAGERALGGVCLRSVSGQVLDEAAAPVPSVVVTVCAEQCFFGKTDAAGRFTVAIDAYLRASRYAVLLHAQPAYAAYYLPLPAGAAGVVTLPKPLPLLTMPTEGPIVPRDGTAGVVRAGGVALTLEAGTDVFLSPEDAAAGPVGGRLRPLRVASPDRLPFLEGQTAPLRAYAFGPFEAAFSKPVKLAVELAVDERAGLPAGTAVEWLAPRSLVNQGAPGGVVEVVSQGRVSTDGARIEMDTGVKQLTWLLVRRKG